MFEFHDPCDICRSALDSPECKDCKFYDWCDSCPYEHGSAACWGNEDCPYNE